ncbi:exosortase F system-associated protein [Flavobacterium sp. K77]|uniref:exosortase F system-associated membrane protein n=1 Tax=Flavobacterium sp. K77 TaxID=2910676 RepID=UPI001F42F6AE|nr:exosortase F system-associated protein [Flavobacterium sp. K77]MCF6140285.1 exosortase F system-associated protein [Flavobacterium sp. K77]
MLRKLLQNKSRFFFLMVLVVLLILVRASENQMFYDPFLDFFKNDFEDSKLPILDEGKLFLGLFFRYFLNTVFSLAIIFILYRDKALIKFASLLYLFFFVVLIVAFYIVLLNDLPNQNWVLFYIRRFIIQPLFLLLFLAGLYYQKQVK